MRCISSVEFLPIATAKFFSDTLDLPNLPPKGFINEMFNIHKMYHCAQDWPKTVCLQITTDMKNHI